MARKPKDPDAEQVRAYFAAVVLNHIDLQAEWEGWRMRGRDLVSPSGQRINPRRLLGLLFAEENRQRVERTRPKRIASVVSLPSRERFNGAA